MKTEETNKLIAEFMGCKVKDDIVYRLDNENSSFVEDLRYHSSWDWVMPVWAKILQWGMKEHGLKWFQSINENYVIIQTFDDGIFMRYLDKNEELSIEPVYEAVVEFIKWYNTDGK